MIRAGNTELGALCNSPTTTPKFLQSPTPLRQDSSALKGSAQHCPLQLHFTPIPSGPPARSFTHSQYSRLACNPSARSPNSNQIWHSRCRGRQLFPPGQFMIAMDALSEHSWCLEQQLLTSSRCCSLQVRSPHSRSGRGSLFTGEQRLQYV
jgi:hypothetical protein